MSNEKSGAEDRVIALLAKYDISTSLFGGPKVRDGRFYISLYQFPVLTFFVDLAAEFGLRLDEISAEAVTEGGCPTCGSWTEVNVEFPLVSSSGERSND